MTETTNAAAATATVRKVFCNATVKVLEVKNDGVSKSAAARPFRSARAEISGLKGGNGMRTVVAFGDQVPLLQEGTEQVLNVLFDGTGGCIIMGPERVKAAKAA